MTPSHYAHSSPSSAPAAQQHGFIELIFGPMFAGKTTELLRRVEQQQRRGMKVAVVKSAKDDRYDLSHIVTHDGLKRVCRGGVGMVLGVVMAGWVLRLQFLGHWVVPMAVHAILQPWGPGFALPAGQQLTASALLAHSSAPP